MTSIASTASTPAPAAGTPVESGPARPLAARGGIAPVHVVGPAVGDEADPEQDIAPNLGGETQMQDA